MTAAVDLLSSCLGSLRRTGLLLVAAGIALGLLLAAHPTSVHRIDGGSLLRIDSGTAASAHPAP